MKGNESERYLSKLAPGSIHHRRQWRHGGASCRVYLLEFVVCVWLKWRRPASRCGGEADKPAIFGTARAHRVRTVKHYIAFRRCQRRAAAWR